MNELRPFGRKNSMQAYNPFRDMENFEKHFFDEPFGFFNAKELDEFKCDITDNGKEYLLEADLPGFKKEDIKLDLDGDILTLSAERHSEFEQKDKKNNYVRCERSYGSYSRQFDVSAVDTAGIKAKLDNGVLKLIMPKKNAIAGNKQHLEIE